jgi:signal transduction histidine kinase
LSPDNALAVESASPQVILAATAHELRLPVSHIKGFVSSLRRTDIAWDGETTRQFLEEIEVEADRLQESIDSLLSNGADHRRGVLNHELQPTKPAKLIQSALHRVHLILRDRLVRLDVPECLPPFQMDRDGIGASDRKLTRKCRQVFARSTSQSLIAITRSARRGISSAMLAPIRAVGDWPPKASSLVDC